MIASEENNEVQGNLKRVSGAHCTLSHTHFEFLLNRDADIETGSGDAPTAHPKVRESTLNKTMDEYNRYIL